MPDSHNSQLKRCSDPFWNSSQSHVKQPSRIWPSLAFSPQSTTKRDHALLWPSIHSPSPSKLKIIVGITPTVHFRARSQPPLPLRSRFATSPKGAEDYSPRSAEPQRGDPGYGRPIRKANPALRHIPRPPAASATSPAAHLRRFLTTLQSPPSPFADRH